MKTIIENGVSFAYLDIRDVEKLEAQIQAENTAELNAQLEQVKDPAQRLALWNQYRPRPSIGELQFWCGQTRRGIVATLELAATKAGAPAGTIHMDVPNASNL